MYTLNFYVVTDEQINTLGGSKVSMGINVLKENYKTNKKRIYTFVKAIFSILNVNQ